MTGESNIEGNDQDLEVSNLLDLRIPGDRNAVSGGTDAISAALIRFDVPEEKRMEIVLAVQEALVNAVVHGCKSDPSKEIRCRLQREPTGRIVIVVSDPGNGFEPAKLADPNRPENFYADHGRGVYLIHQLMDEVRFENGGNQIRMWKY